MKKITRIAPKSLAKMFGALYAIMGFIAGIFFSLAALVMAASGEMGGLFGLAAIILLPLLYGVLGLIFGYITALLYNLIAKRMGGIEFEIE